MNREQAIERLQKLLSLARDSGASEGEVQNAMAFARRLMDEYNIQEADATPDKAESTIIVDEAGVSRITFDFWEKTLGLVIKEVCDVGVYYRPGLKGQELHFVGTERDIAVGRELYAQLTISIRGMARLRQGPGWMQAHRSYCLGFAESLIDKVRQEKAQASARAGAIVLCKNQLVKKWMQENLNLSSGDGPQGRLDTGAYQRGFQDGKTADVGTRRLS